MHVLAMHRSKGPEVDISGLTYLYLVSKVIENEDNGVGPHPDHRA